MSVVFKRFVAVPAPVILEATLLSSEELEAYNEYITDPDPSETSYWYLRTPYDDGLIGCVEGTYEGDPTEPDYEDIPPIGPAGTGLRPVLRIESHVMSDGTILEPGDKILLGPDFAPQWFTVISDTLLLSDRMIGYDEVGNSYGYFDDSTNVYEDSMAKRRVDEWFSDLKAYIDGPVGESLS